MNDFLKKRWEIWKKRSLFSKIIDIAFLFILVMMLSSEGRITLRTWILNLGFMSGVSQNEEVELPDYVDNWQLIDLDGSPHAMAEFSGKPIFLNFWATWCGPCIAEMPSISKLIEEKDSEVVFLLVSYEKPEVVKSFLEKKGWSFPVYFPATAIPPEFEAEAIPTTFLIDRNGKMVHRSSGMTKWNGKSALAFIDRLISDS